MSLFLKLEMEKKAELTVSRRVKWRPTIRAIIRARLVTSDASACAAGTFAKSIAAVRSSASTGSAGACVDPSAIASIVRAIWLCVSAIPICVRVVERRQWA